jgi:hypothetical protein
MESHYTTTVKVQFILVMIISLSGVENLAFTFSQMYVLASLFVDNCF